MLGRKCTMACDKIWYVLATHTLMKMFRIALIQAADKNEMSRALGHLCAHIG